MNWKNALGALQREHPEDELHPMYTVWGENLDPEHVWEEYPRPQMRRDNCTTLNGFWEYRIEERGRSAVSPGEPFVPDGQILVPFSPECLLSGVNRQLLPGQKLWYQREIPLQNPGIPGGRCILHFQAVDQEAKVYVNGRLRAYHRGGYLPFDADITDAAGGTPCLLQVCVRDISDTGYHARGKQKLARGGMFYTAQSGIWQTVWYEWVPDNFIRSMKLEPDFDRRRLTVRVVSDHEFNPELSVYVGIPSIYSGENDEKVGDTSKSGRENPGVKEKTPRGTSVPAEDVEKTPDGTSVPAGDVEDVPDEYRKKSNRVGGETENIPDNNNKVEMTVLSRKSGRTDAGVETAVVCELPGGIPFRAWTPAEPYLYPLTLRAGEDVVESYFALRCFTVRRDERDICRFYLNHEPLFLDGVLDQGYWSDGLMTAPCDEALLFDLNLAKDSGFNMVRKHLKIENLRWYFHCDRLGLLVWQDMVNGGTAYDMNLVCYAPTVLPAMGGHFTDYHYEKLSREDRAGREEWEEECRQTIDLLYNVPSLAVWVPFNEGWGQFDASRITAQIRRQDPTRLVDHASGWFDQGTGDFRSVHNYFRKLTVEDPGRRAFVLSEYGGISCQIPGHASVERVYGYQKLGTPEEMTEAYRKLREDFPELERQGLCGAVYTQLSDIEEEVNGLVTYDRRVVKLQQRRGPENA